MRHIVQWCGLKNWTPQQALHSWGTKPDNSSQTRKYRNYNYKGRNRIKRRANLIAVPTSWSSCLDDVCNAHFLLRASWATGICHLLQILSNMVKKNTTKEENPAITNGNKWRNKLYLQALWFLRLLDWFLLSS